MLLHASVPSVERWHFFVCLCCEKRLLYTKYLQTHINYCNPISNNIDMTLDAHTQRYYDSDSNIPERSTRMRVIIY